jgi:hypothetical protein
MNKSYIIYVLIFIGMTCGFNEYELFIIWKICHRNRWCAKHISRHDLVNGMPSDKIGMYKDAIDSLVAKGMLSSYHAQGRNDVCMPKHRRKIALEALKAHQSDYAFIVYLEFIN